jgi:hypothetical protein
MYLSGKKKNSTGRIALTLILAAALFLAACAVPDGGSSAASVNSKSYAVLIGIDRSRISRLKPYRTVVIEPEGFRASDIRKLHRQKKKVYAYINIGSIEKSRSYYSRFSDITLGDYENWPDERWVDVSKKEWQDFVVDELARKYARQGYDGFFLDNADVYYEVPQQSDLQRPPHYRQGSACLPQKDHHQRRQHVRDRVHEQKGYRRAPGCCEPGGGLHTDRFPPQKVPEAARLRHALLSPLSEEGAAQAHEGLSRGIRRKGKTGEKDLPHLQEVRLRLVQLQEHLAQIEESENSQTGPAVEYGSIGIMKFSEEDRI